MDQKDKDLYMESIVKRLDLRVKTLADKAERIKKNYLENKRFNDHESEANRIWLDQFTGGVGFDIAVGDFPLGAGVQAIGIDGAANAFGVDWVTEGDDLRFQGNDTLDYVVTNYLDGMGNPLKCLHEWARVVKPGGTVAVVVRDADHYTTALGALQNARRNSVFTQKTLSQYLFRVGLKSVSVEKHPKTGSLRGFGTV